MAEAAFPAHPLASIGEAAERSGLPAKTIRYYEEIGLVRPARGANGYRAFGAEEIHKLAFLARARSLGFSVAECRALLSLWEDRGRASADVKALAHRHLAEIERKIAELDGLRATLAALVRRCQGDDRPDCPILDDLAGAGPPREGG
jgi:Cu(I)-responsive transcriptional regulator